MNYSTGMKWITAIAEGFLAIPLIGGVFVISTGYSALRRHVYIPCDYVTAVNPGYARKRCIHPGSRDERSECYSVHRLVHAPTDCWSARYCRLSTSKRKSIMIE